MAILPRLRQVGAVGLASFARLIDQNAVTNMVLNKVNQAFFGTMGQVPAAYDHNKPTYIDSGYLVNPIVYSIIKQRSDKARSVPYFVKRINDQAARKQLKMLDQATKGDYRPQQQIRRSGLFTKAFEEKYIDFPLEKPNANQSWGDIIALYETFMGAVGEFYLYTLKGAVNNEPMAVYVLPAHQMKIILKPNAKMLGIESPISHYMLIEGNQYIEFEEENVIHIKLPNPEYKSNGEHLYGLSPLRSALKNLQSSNLGLDGNVRTMLNSGAFGFVHGKGNTPLTDTQAKSIKSRLQEMDASNDRLSKIQGATAELGFTQIALNTDELKPFDFLGFDTQQIANVLGWDTILLNNDSRAKFDNYEAASKGVVIRTTKPSLDMFCEAVNEKLLPQFKSMQGAEFMFDFTELPEMQTDIGKMVDWLSKARADGAINLNEYRMAIKYPLSDDPNMDVHTVQNDIIPLEEALAMDFSITNDQTGI